MKLKKVSATDKAGLLSVIILAIFTSYLIIGGQLPTEIVTNTILGFSIICIGVCCLILLNTEKSNGEKNENI